MLTGAHVFLICDADRCGTVNVTPCIVALWGKQRVCLLDALTGKPHEARLYVKHLNSHLNPHILSVSETPDVRAAALTIAEGYLQIHRTHLERIINSEDFEEQNHAYKHAMRVRLAALHEPRVIVHGNELKAGGAR